MCSSSHPRLFGRSQTWTIVGLSLAVLLVLAWNPSIPPPVNLPEDTKPCWKLASRVDEPRSAEYQFDPQGVDMDGPVWSDYRWEGNITQELFMEAIERDSRSYVRFKILDNVLYMHEPSYWGQTNSTKMRANTFAVGVKMALMMFKVPDVDILMDLENVQQHVGDPSLVIAFQGKKGDSAGFAVPGPIAIRRALGPVQMESLHQCLMERYPLGYDRIPKAVWRGTWERIGSTRVPRARLVEAATALQSVADVKFDGYRSVRLLQDGWLRSSFLFKRRRSDF